MRFAVPQAAKQPALTLHAANWLHVQRRIGTDQSIARAQCGEATLKEGEEKRTQKSSQRSETCKKSVKEDATKESKYPLLPSFLPSFLPSQIPPPL